MVSSTQKEWSRMTPWVSNVAFGGDWTGSGGDESTHNGLTRTLSRRRVAEGPVENERRGKERGTLVLS